MDGYKALRPVPIEAPAEMLESWAGYAERDARRVLGEAVMVGLDVLDDSAGLQWLACGIERRLVDLSVAAGGV